MTRICIIDYGLGNLRSVQKACNAIGAEAFLTSDPGEVMKAPKIILPGVGAFGDGMLGLTKAGLVEPLKQAVANQIPLLGICLGMQILFEASEESPGTPGLGFLPGQVRRFKGKWFSSQDTTSRTGRKYRKYSSALSALKIPQTGWNQLQIVQETPLLAGILPGSYAYFNHAFYCEPVDQKDWLASTEYGMHYASMVGHGNISGVQFHPEKSQAVGLAILRNFLERF
jgi:glutamine amidotransferase